MAENEVRPLHYSAPAPSALMQDAEALAWILRLLCTISVIVAAIMACIGVTTMQIGGVLTGICAAVFGLLQAAAFYFGSKLVVSHSRALQSVVDRVTDESE